MHRREKKIVAGKQRYHLENKKQEQLKLRTNWTAKESAGKR
jgi:phosphopantetheinyl transferase (holo-ACP synthase)